MLFENCRLKAKRVVNPIVDWSDADLWQFLLDSKAPVNSLYGEGWCRVGCVGCPMAGKKGREEEFLRWPKYKQLYINAFENMIKERIRRGKIDGSWRMGTTGKDVFNWWMEYDTIPGQIDIFDLLEEEDE
jgi:phosphoadenosine phosphosulfate reductase